MSQVALKKMGTDFTMTVPTEIVDCLHLQEGQKLDIRRENGHVILTPIPTEYQETMQAHQRMMEKYRSTFQRLANA